jgi:alkylhydroperoxidase family enzyme
MQRGHGLFARELVAKKGRIADADVEAVRAAGFTDGDIAEVIAHVALCGPTSRYPVAR